MRIIEDDLSGAEIAALLREHLSGMARHSPPDSVHALDLAGLQENDVSFWTVHDDDSGLLGCGALKELDRRHGEVKSMRTATAHLGKGVASHLLNHILNVARARAYQRVSLETGSGEAFEAAHALYRNHGFEYCGPFGPYTDDPFSRFMTLKL